MEQSSTVTRAKPGMADWLSLAATPTFAIMALATCAPGAGPPDPMCLASREGAIMNPMLLMYVLMSVFHLAPWFRLAACWRTGRRAISAAAQHLP